MSYIEGAIYKLQHDYYNDIKLECVYVDGTFAYLNNPIKGELYRDYKVSLKTKKLYVFNKCMATWDTIENTLSECTAEDVWSKAATSYVSSYNGVNEDLI